MKLYGIYLGLIQDGSDESGQGRVKALLPALGDTMVTTWAPVASPWAGTEHGAYYLPRQGDTVLIAFQNGDFNAPCVIGSVYNGVDKPFIPPEQQGAVVGWQTPGKQTLLLDDSEDNAGYRISDSKGNQIVVKSEDNSIAITVSGNISITTTEGAVNVRTDSGTITLKGTSINLEAEESISLKASAQIKIEAESITASGMSINLGE